MTADARRTVGVTRGPDPMPWWKPAGLFLAVGSVAWLTVSLGAAFLPRDYMFPRSHPAGGPLIEGWVRWDAGWYREIVRHGYRYTPGVQSAVAYFPAYPLAVVAVAWAFPGIAAAAVFVTVMSGLGAAVLFHRWCSTRMSPGAATTALVVLLVYPYSWYLYGAIYSDAFFLLVVLAAFLLVERDQLWLAGIAGFVATASRPTGIAVAIGLVLLVLERRNLSRPVEPQGATPDDAIDPGADLFWSARGLRVRARFVLTESARRFDPRAWSWSAAPVLAAFGGLAAWSGYLWARFGDPLLFVHIEGQWGQGTGPHTWFKLEFLHQLRFVPHSLFSSGLILHAAVGIGTLVLVPRVARRFGWAYALYVLAVMGIPVLGTKDFMSCGRYALAAFPCFAVVGEWLAERPSPLLRNAWIVASAGLLLVFSALWSMGKYLA